MNQDEIKAIFDQQAAGYDAQWAKMLPIRNCLHMLLESMFADLPKDVCVLCVGVGTGAELAHLAQKNPKWRFTAVEPSGAMLKVCRQLAEKQGFAARWDFHEGYLESLSANGAFDAATCFLYLSSFSIIKNVRRSFAKYRANSSQAGFWQAPIWLRM